jgi:hypothetical protein
MLSRSLQLGGLAAVLMLAVGCTPVHAQVWGGDRDHDRDRGYYGQNYQRQAYDNGYRRGMDRGERDGRDGRAMNFRDEKDYRNGDWGYNSRYGPRDYYRQSFRSGFEAGYYAGYNRYSRGAYGGYGTYGGRAVPRPPVYGNGGPVYGNTGAYGYPSNSRYGYAGDIGYQNGYRDGLEKGQKDWRDRKSYDVLRHDWYRDGDRHYKKEYGYKQDYENAYRAGFKRGYDEAFRGGRVY